MTGLEGSRRVEGRVSEDTRAREAANRRRRGLVRHHSARGTRGDGVSAFNIYLYYQTHKPRPFSFPSTKATLSPSHLVASGPTFTADGSGALYLLPSFTANTFSHYFFLDYYHYYFFALLLRLIFQLFVSIRSIHYALLIYCRYEY